MKRYELQLKYEMCSAQGSRQIKILESVEVYLYHEGYEIDGLLVVNYAG
jgi:hypothetical protein